VLLLLADEYRPTCSFFMINPASLAMGFAEADPRQLAPSVRTTHVGITISAVPSLTNHDSRARTRSSPLEEFKFIANLSIAPPRSLGPQLDQAQHLATTKVVTDGKEHDDPEGKRKDSTREFHSKSRNTRQKIRHPLDPPPPGLPPHDKTVTLKPRPASTTTRIEGQMISPTSSKTSRSMME